VFDYERAAAASLVAYGRRVPGIVFEAHSTDYQQPEALRALVADRFGVLKVGPWLTFAFRQAVLGLEAIEREWLGGRKAVAPSRLREALEAAMDEDPRHWLGHHRPGDEALRALRIFGYSDRVRYYWPAPGVQEALGRLFANLLAFPPPPPLVGQHLPRQYDALRAGEIGQSPEELVRYGVNEVLRLYARASGELP
jgi:D-tagatose-1,6-bisphosphate aldolase subunit GatZ/KbaZ